MVDQGLPRNPPREAAVIRPPIGTWRRIALGAAALGAGSFATGLRDAAGQGARARLARGRPLQRHAALPRRRPGHRRRPGRALAECAGREAVAAAVPADENMADDLRNMVWKGHYLGFGPADVLMHVPVDRPLMEANPQVTHLRAVLARARGAIARNARQGAGAGVARPARLAGGRGAGPVAGRLAADRRRGRRAARAAAHAVQRRRRGRAALQARRGAGGRRPDVGAGVGAARRRSLRRRALPSPRAPREGWAVGMAVKKDATDLAQALQAAVDKLRLAMAGLAAQCFARGNVAWRPV